MASNFIIILFLIFILIFIFRERGREVWMEGRLHDRMPGSHVGDALRIFLPLFEYRFFEHSFTKFTIEYL
jgi:hypothetical protein